MKEKIKSITEAYSMQPKTLFVHTNNKPSHDKENTIKEILLKTIIKKYKWENPNKEISYIGYDFNNKKLFQYLANSDNVHYF